MNKSKELEDVIKNLHNQEKKILGLKLLKEIKFTEKLLDKMRKDINSAELVVEMQQGEYSINRSNPLLKTYNTTVKNYASIIKNLNDIILEEKKIELKKEYQKAKESQDGQELLKFLVKSYN